MTNPEPSGWEKVIRAVSSVKTRSALAALSLFLLFFMFWIVLILTTGYLQWVLSILILLMFGFFTYQTVCIRDITERRIEPTKTDIASTKQSRLKQKRG
jgi:ABC-type bacteriocin/lantibiotic exporter with double-glycine peptidase domain